MGKSRPPMFPGEEAQQLPLPHKCDDDTEMPHTTGEIHTLVIKHIPCRCTRDELLNTINKLGFAGSYEFFHLPTKRGHHHNFGYAFISFNDPVVTSNFRRTMNGFQLQSRRSLKEITVEPAHVQGFFGSARNLASARVATGCRAAGDDMKIIYKHERRRTGRIKK